MFKLWVIKIALAIIFLFSYPKVGITIFAIMGLGVLFENYSSKFYLNLFIGAIFAYEILDTLSHKYLIAQMILSFVKFLGTISKLTKFYNSEFVSSLLILSVLLTVSDILAVKLFSKISMLSTKAKKTYKLIN